MQKLFTQEEKDYIMMHYASETTASIAKALNKKVLQIYSFAYANRLRKNSEYMKTPGSGRYMRGKFKTWTNSEADYVTNNYPNIRTDIIANHLNKSVRIVYAFANHLGLKKSAEFLASPESGIFTKGMVKDNGHRFVKGHISHNKGQKMSHEVYEKSKHTFFKKGHRPHNTKEDGCLSVRTDTETGIQYIYQRVAKGKWVELHRLKFEEKNGPIPKGFNVIFKDHDHSNFADDNLVLVSDKELMLLNSFHKYPQDLKNLIYAKGALSREINQLNKDGKTNN